MKLQQPKTAPRKNYGRTTRAFFATGFVILIGAGIYGYMQYNKLAEVQTAIAAETAMLTKIQTAENEIRAAYTSIKTAYDADFTSIRERIAMVLPPEEEYTKLTRILDDFVIENNNTTLNPIFMSNISFGRPSIDQENGYSVLPFTLDLDTTRENFEKFLEFIENSGSLENGIRLMEVDSISINFPTKTSSPFTTSADLQAKIPTINVNLSLKAYFQLPTETQTQPK